MLSLYFKNFNRYSFKTFSKTAQTFKVVTPAEIRNTIRLMRIQNTNINFTHFDKFNLWKNPNEALEIFKEFAIFASKQYNINYYQNSNIFDDLKTLLKNLEMDPEDSSNTYFYSEFIKILKVLYIDNLNDKDFIKNNLHYPLRCFVFIKTIMETEIFVKKSQFLDDFFEILNLSAEVYIKQTYINDYEWFKKNHNIMEEFLSRCLNLSESKYLVAFNPTYFRFKLKIHLEKIISNFDCLILHMVLNKKPELISEKIKEIAQVMNRHQLSNGLTLDYINIFLISNKTYFNVFYLIDILHYLSIYKNCINFEILNCFYNTLEKETNSKNIVNFPSEYFIKSLRILSQNNLIGSFMLTEKIIELYKQKNSEEFQIEEIISIVSTTLKTGNSNENILKYFLSMVVKKNMLENLNYNLITNLKGLIDRFITEDFEYPEFFEYVYFIIKKKLENLEQLNLKENYDNSIFVEFIKNELTIAKLNFVEEVLTKEDYIKYMESCNWICLQCLFKIYKNYEFKSIGLIEFRNNEEEVALSYDYFKV